MKKNILDCICFLIISTSSLGLQAQTELHRMPDLSMIQTATFLELMQSLSKRDNKVLWLCGNDVIKKVQKKDPNNGLSPDCRSELNRVLTRDLSSGGVDIVGLAHEITKGLRTQVEKTSAIYSWVTENINYDVVTYTSLVKNKKLLTNPMEVVAPSRVLETRLAVAEGYSLLTAALLRAVNIPAVTVVGVALLDGKTQGPHAWNEAYVDDRWINLDATWDAGGLLGNFEDGLEFISQPSRKYFDMPDYEFKKTHKAVIDFK